MFKSALLKAVLLSCVISIINALIGWYYNMNIVINVIINIIITLIVFGFVFIFSYYKFLKNIPQETEKRINELLNTRLNYETENHNACLQALNPDNRFLAQEHKVLSQDHKEIKECLYNIDKQIYSEQAKKGALSGKELDINKTVEQLSAMVDLLADYRKQIAELQAENERLRAAVRPVSYNRHQDICDDNEMERE